MAAKELDEWTRAAERAEMRIRLKARIARLLEAAGRGRKGTVLHSQAEARQRGFPTHAGIDRASRSLERGRRGFPHTRGDRPFLALSREPRPQISPHTRG